MNMITTKDGNMNKRFLIAISLFLLGAVMNPASAQNSKPAVVLVHGGFVDGSGWEDVYKILKKDGYNVSIVQNPTSSLADDVAATDSPLSGAKAAI